MGLRAEKIYGILQELNTNRQTGVRGDAAALGGFFATRPIGMIGPVVVTFRMRHQAEDPPGGVANTGNIADRAIGVERKTAASEFTIGQGILNGHLVIFPKLSQGAIVCIELSFTMAYREFRQIDSSGENTGRRRIHFKGDPLVSEISAVIIGKRHRSTLIVSPQAWQQTQVDQRLESIANPQNKITIFNKFNNLTADVSFQPNGLNDTGTMIVTPAESPYKHKDLKAFKVDRAVYKGIDMNPRSIGTGQF